MGIKVICVNNFNYGMTGGQQGPTTPLEAFTTTSPYGNIEHPFNLVHLAAASGAVYVARWTTLHVRRLTQSIKKVLQKEGFCFIEVVSPCPEIFGRYNKMRSGLEMMEWFKKASSVESFSDPAKAEITFDRIVVGEFVDVEKLSYEKLLHEKISQINEKALEQVADS
jgi:2-oxoglutarate ferredoxin oxidoreductase subunit beta